MKKKEDEFGKKLLKALPGPRQSPVSCTAIHDQLPRPRMSPTSLRGVLDALVLCGLVEAISAGRYTYYRKGKKALGRPPVLGIATPTRTAYNDHARSESSLEKADSFLGVLTPLNKGKSVALWMDDPRRGDVKNTHKNAHKNAEPRRRLVVLIPGPAAGLPKGAVIVCVIGSGSCIVRVDQPTKVADLVLAGIPARLATILMDTVHRVLKE